MHMAGRSTVTANPDSRGLPDGFRLTATDRGVDTTTDINGHYLFTDLTDGAYRVWIAVESTTSAS